MMELSTITVQIVEIFGAGIQHPGVTMCVETEIGIIAPIAWKVY